MQTCTGGRAHARLRSRSRSLRLARHSQIDFIAARVYKLPMSSITKVFPPAGAE